jgi:heptosyltransferase-2
LIAQTDCRHYTGYKPCGRRDDCTACPDYAPWAKQILIIKLAAVGDVVRTTAILPGLKKEEPDCCITWLTDEAALPLLMNNPLIDRVYPFTVDGLNAVLAAHYSLLLNFEKEARALGFARAVSAITRKGFMASRSGTPAAADADSEYALRLGLSDELKFRANTLTYPQIIYEMAGLPYGGQEYVLELSETSARFAHEFCQRLSGAGCQPVRIVGLNTGCGTVFATKRWTVEGFVELINELAPMSGVRLALLGGPLEVEFSRAIKEFAGDCIIDSGCNNSMEEFLGLIECCDVVVSSDSLAMHLAIGRKKQVVALFGPTCHQEVDLFGRGEKIVTEFDCAPCYFTRCDKTPSCMDALRGTTVAAAVRRCLEKVRT